MRKKKTNVHEPQFHCLESCEAGNKQNQMTANFNHKEDSGTIQRPTISPPQPPKQTTINRKGYQPQSQPQSQLQQPDTSSNHNFSNNNQIKFPPIILHESSLKQTGNILEKKMKDYYIKRITNNKHILLTETNNYKTACEILKQNKIQFFMCIPKTENTYILNHTFKRPERRFRYGNRSPGANKKKTLNFV